MTLAAVQPGRGQAAAHVSVCLLAVLLSACAAHRGSPAASRSARDGSLATYVAKVRTLSAEAKPSPKPPAETLETFSPALKAALADLALEPTAEAHRRVAAVYRRQGVLDMAYQHLTDALTIDPADAASHEGLARIWRDWGAPHLGLSDARQAVSLAPVSASAANTLGTVLQAMGQLQDASTSYARALDLDPSATYAANNLCYVAIMSRDRTAVTSCRVAVAADPASRIAGNNLALAYAASGDFEHARGQFASAGADGELFNMGIVYMATHQYREAASAFGQALQADPRSTLAATRSRQARLLAAKAEN